MSLAIKWGDNDPENGGFIYFDAVTAFTQDFTGQVTKHPIDGGASITDHFVKENPKFTLSAVITGVDVSSGSYNIVDENGTSPFNVRPAPTAVSVTSTDNSILSKFIPDSIGQFLPDQTPEVTMDSERSSVVDQIADLISELVSGVRINNQTGEFENNINLIKLYSYKRNLLNKVINNLVITSVRFNEDANTGDALYCDITFEQVSFAELRLTTIPAYVTQPMASQAAGRRSEGKVDSTESDPDNPATPEEQRKSTAVKAWESGESTFEQLLLMGE